MARAGVILLGFGGPDSIEAVEPFMCALMGRTPSPELVERICGNYNAIGGKSPLADIANDIAEGLSATLGDAGHDVPVRVGMRYWHPYIADALRGLADEGCTRVVTVSLSPFESKVASGQYRLAIEEALDSIGGIEIVEAPLISELPAFMDYLAESTRFTLAQLPAADSAVVAFTAHSLPVADLDADDPYVAGLQRVASGIAQRLGWAGGTAGAGAQLLGGLEAFGTTDGSQPWLLVYQSKGARPGAWLEPNLEVLIDSAGSAGIKSIAVCPIGFVTDHMETLFDLDTVAAARANDAGLAFGRASVPNDDPVIVKALAEAVSRLI
jgi:ferrochelatase